MNPAEFDAWLVGFIQSCSADLPDSLEWDGVPAELEPDHEHEDA